MKKIFTVLLAIVFIGLIWSTANAEEFYKPQAHQKGVIGGDDGEEWRLGCFTGLKLNGITYILPAADGAASQYLQTDGAGTLSWATGGATEWDDIADPTGDQTINWADNYTTIFSMADTNEDMFTIRGIGAFGDVSILKVESLTGNPTDGTVLEVVAHDANVDPLVVSSSAQAGALVVGQDGTVDIPLDLDVTGTFTAGTWAINSVAASTATQTLTLDGNGIGGVNIGSTSTGDITLGNDVVVSDTYNVLVGEGSLTIDNDQNEDALIITSDHTTAGSALDITSTNTTSQAARIVASATSSGDVLYLQATEATLAGGGNYLKLYDGAANDLTVARYGATTIAGNASTDALTLTAGDIQITNGDIDLDNGQLMVDTTQDLANNISRNYPGAGTGPALSVVETNASSTNSALTVSSAGTAGTALKVDQTGTGNAIGFDLNLAGDYPGIDIDASAARDGDVIDILMTNMVDERALNVTGAMTGANGEGVIEVHSTGNMADGASLIRLDTDTGTPAGTTAGFAINIDDDSLAQANAYAVLINSANNEGLNVATGKALFAEQATFTAGIDADGDLDIDFSANTEELSIETTAVDFAAGGALATIHGDHAGNTNDAPLLRLVYQADGDAQDTFLLCEDNSTGAAGNGDDQFKVSASGAVTQAGSLTVNGDQIIGDGATEMVGVRNDTVDAGATNPYTVTAAMSGTVFFNSQAVEFDLPAAAAGLIYTFTVAHASNLHIDPDAADTISYIGCAAGDRLLSSTVGDTVTVQGISDGTWMVVAVTPGDGSFVDTIWTDAN